MAADLVEGEDAEAVAQFVAVASGGTPSGDARRRLNRRADVHPAHSGTLRRRRVRFRRSVRNHVPRVGSRAVPTWGIVMKVLLAGHFTIATMPGRIR